MIPEGWRESEIKNLIHVTRGFAFKSEQYTSDGMFVLRVSNINETGRINSKENRKFISFSEAGDYSQYSLKARDVLLVMVGATTGKLGVLTQDSLPALLNQNLWCLRGKREVIDQSFLKYLMEYCVPSFVSQQQGSAREFIKQSDFSVYKLLTPPFPEQIRIAEILTSVDDAIAATEKVITQTKRVKQALLQKLLTRGIGHTKFKMTEIGEIPESWEVVEIGSILKSSTYGVNKSLQDDSNLTPVLRMGNIQENKLDLTNLKYCELEDTDNQLLAKDDILFNRTNSYDLVGKVALVNTTRKLSYASYLIRLRTNHLAHPRWLLEVMSSSTMQKKFKSIATLGVSQCNINPTKMKKLLIALPNLEEQKNISQQFSKIDDFNETTTKFLSKLKDIKLGLLQDLLTGQVRINTESKNLC